MKTNYLFLLLFLPFQNFAQPTITSSWAPSIGMHVQSQPFNYNLPSLDEGNAGANVTWDLSSIDTSGVGGSLGLVAINPSTAPQNSFFPNATDCIFSTDSFYTFDRLNGSVYQNIGSYQPSQSGSPYVTTIYSDPMDIFHFPYTYASTFFDTGVYRDISGGSIIDTLIGHITQTDTTDGYGTLITKAGTFTNVLRKHTIQMELDTDIVQHTTSIIENNLYNWYSSEYPGITLASIGHYTTDGFLTDLGDYSIFTLTGIHPLSGSGISDWSIMPQPSAQTTNIIIQNNSLDKAIDIVVYDMSGRLIKGSSHSLSSGKNQIGINVSDLANGIYSVSLNYEHYTSSQKLVVRH
jgi:hypothetical protein